jgi:hypothetical protein
MSDVALVVAFFKSSLRNVLRGRDGDWRGIRKRGVRGVKHTI